MKLEECCGATDVYDECCGATNVRRTNVLYSNAGGECSSNESVRGMLCECLRGHFKLR